MIINIPHDIHITIGDMATIKGITITRYVLQAVAEQIIKDKIHE